MVEASDFLDLHIVDISHDLEQEKLEKLIIIVYDTFARELSMTEEEKKQAIKLKNNFLNESKNIYTKAPLDFIKVLEKKDDLVELENLEKQMV
ncbi:hypothetical protein HOG21_01030 [bacterium]|nr:hypothetical protein [bacterium]